MFEVEYVDEKFSHAVWLLAVGVGRIQERMVDAWREFSVITEESIPPTLIDDFRALQNLVPGVPEDGEPTVPEALLKMSDEESVALARALCNYNTRVEGYVEDKG